MHLAITAQAFLSLQNIRHFPGPHCLYDAFIASILFTIKMGVQFLEQIEVRRSHDGGEEGFQIHIQSQQSWNL